MSDGRAKTINPSFNDAWNYLVEIHGIDLMDNQTVTALRICKTPNFRKSTNDWIEYLHAFVSVLRIGARKQWVNLHLDGQGRPMWLTIDTKLLSGETR